MDKKRVLVVDDEQDLCDILLYNLPKDVVVTERTVDVNMARLRKKIGRYAQCIVARQGYGYCFEEI